LFNEDFELQMPEKVIRLKSKIEQADAMLIASPEYNNSIPGPLKNAIDWASRPWGDNSFHGKPVAVMSASVGMLGGVRAQMQLRQVFRYLDMMPINYPEVFVGNAEKKFDGSGALVDEEARRFLKDLVKNLVNWARKLQMIRKETPS